MVTITSVGAKKTLRFKLKKNSALTFLDFTRWRVEFKKKLNSNMDSNDENSDFENFDKTSSDQKHDFLQRKLRNVNSEAALSKIYFLFKWNSRPRN